MTIAKIIEISADSKVSFQDAIEAGIARAEAPQKRQGCLDCRTKTHC